MKLFSYWRSTTSYRVRVALAMKGIACDIVPINLLKAEQKDPDYVALNPVKGVPTLVTDEGAVLTQSMAILDYLDNLYPDPPLLPSEPLQRAQAMAAALVMATDTHPVNNLKVINAIKALGHDQDIAVNWMRSWMGEGFTAFNALIDPETPFCFGDTPGLADICLVAQLYNAHRWDVDLSTTARLTDIEQRCLALPAFDAARPENQVDAT